jgi:ribosomal protein S18 acetylase RimI-like enzyme
MNKIAISRGKPGYAEDFVRLDLISAPDFLPYYFGSNMREILRSLFQDRGNWWSFEHSQFIRLDGRIAGMALAMSYEDKIAEKANTMKLVDKYVKGSVFDEPPDERIMEIQGQAVEGDYYISNVAVYPKFRCMGLGTKLFERIEQMAIKHGSRRIVFDVETDKTRTINLYKRLGYGIESRSAIVETKVRGFELFQMAKVITNTKSRT